MAYTLSNLLQQGLASLGQSYTTTATSGSVSTAIDTKLAEKFQDSDFEDGGTLIVVRDAGGASAVPEGEFSNITSYSQDSNTFNVSPSLTTAIAAGDTFMFCLPIFPLYEMIEAANRALQIENIVLTDTSITTALNQTEHTWPTALKQKPPVITEIQGITTDANDNKYSEINAGRFTVTPAAAGSTGLITIPQFAAGYTIKLQYETTHPLLTAYNSVIHETIHPKLAVASFVVEALMWYNNRTAGNNAFWVSEQLKAEARLVNALRKYRVWKPRKKPAYLFLHSNTEDTVFPTVSLDD